MLHIACLLTEDGEPSNYQEVINNSDSSLWMAIMQEDVEALHKNQIWKLVLLPPGKKKLLETSGFIRSNMIVMIK